MRAFARRLMQAMTLFWLGMAAWMLADAVQELMRGRATHAAAAAAYSLAWVWLFRAWLVCERQSRCTSLAQDDDAWTAARNTLQPPAAGVRVWTDDADGVTCRCLGGPLHGEMHRLAADTRAFASMRAYGHWYERSGDVLLYVGRWNPETREAA